MCCRPRGGYSHSFLNDNAFDFGAYGEIITHGGGTSPYIDNFARITLSHNGLLVDGSGQYQPIHYPRSKRVGREQQLAYRRGCHIAAYEETDDYTYWGGMPPRPISSPFPTRGDIADMCSSLGGSISLPSMS